jgi:hypothetical protein
MLFENIFSLVYSYVNYQFGDKMRTKNEEWLPLDVAAERFGYAHKESLSRRLRQLRRENLVIDTGRPPANYRDLEPSESARIVLMWPNPKTALLRADAPRELLSARRGRPPISRR